MARLGDRPRALVCLSCHRPADATERFCPTCRLPLVLDEPPGDGLAVSERHRRARMVKPQLTEGAPVRVAGARNQSEAEFIQGLLLEEGVPSMLRRTAGFDVPDMLAAGPRDILVPGSGLATAREVLLEAELIPATPAVEPAARPWRLLAGLLIALALGALVIGLAAALGH